MQFRTQMIGLAAAAALAGTAAAVMGPNNPEGAPGSAKNRPGSNTPAPGGGKRERERRLARPDLLDAAKKALIFAQQEVETRQHSGDVHYISKAVDVAERLQEAIDLAEGIERAEEPNEWIDA